MRPSRAGLRRNLKRRPGVAAPLRVKRAVSSQSEPPVVPSEGPFPADIDPDHLLKLVHQEVDARMGALVEELDRQLETVEQKMMTTAADVVGQTIHDRVASLEHSAVEQTQELAVIEQTSGSSARSIDAALTAIERLLIPLPPESSPPQLAPPEEPQDPQEVTGEVEVWKPAFVPTFAHTAPVKPAPVNKPKGLTVQKSRYRCPHCSSTNITRSGRETFYEEFLRLFFIKPMRCQRCFRRFLRF